MDNVEHLFDIGLGEYVARRRDEILKKDDAYHALVKVYTDTMTKFEALDLPYETKFIINEYILAMSAMDVECECACYLAGVTDMLILMQCAGRMQ